MERRNAMQWIDLRSDTVTHPTPEMRSAMASAEVGDDVYGEDPTVNQLEERAAEILGKEAAIFVPSGTMANLIAVLVHCDRGSEVILGDQSHIYLDEAGGMSACGGIHPRPLPNQPDGTLELESIEAAIRPDDEHYPITQLICLESPHNACGGVPLTLDYLQAVRDLAQEHHLKLHLDGARIFNAAAYFDVDPRQIAQNADSVMFCFSKGLCAPVGSALCGDRAFIQKARRARKLLGGGMRQAGILAAAGLVALETILPRLAEDHQRTRRLADALVEMPGIELDTYPPQTNMIYFQLKPDSGITPEQLAQSLEERGILIFPEARIRLVLHYWIDDDAVESIIAAFREVLGNQS